MVIPPNTKNISAVLSTDGQSSQATTTPQAPNPSVSSLKVTTNGTEVGPIPHDSSSSNPVNK
jgi:hypothetical protein